MSGDIAVRDDINGTILGHTLEECRNAGWVSVRQFAAGFNKVRRSTKAHRPVKTWLDVHYERLGWKSEHKPGANR